MRNQQKLRKEKRKQPSKTPSFFFFLSSFVFITYKCPHPVLKLLNYNNNFFTDFQRKKSRLFNCFFITPPFRYLLIKMLISSTGRSHNLQFITIINLIILFQMNPSAVIILVTHLTPFKDVYFSLKKQL